LADRAGERRGHPIGVAARVPGVPDFALGLGMDGVAWVQEGLVDILIPCATWRPSDTDIPMEAWRELIGPQAKAYRLAAGTDLWLRGTGNGRFMRTSMESLRGFTSAALDRGADQIYLFNHFAPTDFKLWYRTLDGQRKHEHVYYDLLSEGGCLKTALSKPRRHVLTYHDPVPADSDYRRPLPVDITTDRPVQLRLYTGAKPTDGRYVIRIGVDQWPGYEDARLAVRLNSIECEPIEDLPAPAEPKVEMSYEPAEAWCVGEVAPRVVQFEAPIQCVKRGYNTIQLAVEQGAQQRVVWLEIYVDARRRNTG
jgi:hypothetical protein